MDEPSRLRKAVEILMIKYQVTSLEKLCQRIDIGRSYLSELMNGSKPINSKFLSKLKYKEGVNDLYITDGILPILFPDFIPENDPSLSKTLKIAAGIEQNKTTGDNGNYQSKRFNHKLTSAPQFMVPLVPVKARAGYINSHQLFEFIESLEKYPIAPGVDPRGYEWRWFEVAGESMEPNFYEGDFILCSMVPHDQWGSVQDYLVHVIVTDHDILIKRVIKEKGGETWILHSDNKAVKQQRLHLSEVKEVWKFRRNLNARVPPTERIKVEI